MYTSEMELRRLSVKLTDYSYQEYSYQETTSSLSENLKMSGILEENLQECLFSMEFKTFSHCLHLNDFSTTDLLLIASEFLILSVIIFSWQAATRVPPLIEHSSGLRTVMQVRSLTTVRLALFSVGYFGRLCTVRCFWQLLQNFSRSDSWKGLSSKS